MAVRPSRHGGRSDSGVPAARLSLRVGEIPLRARDTDARHIVANIESGAERTLTSQELMAPGLLATIPERPGAALITYRRIG